MNAFQTLAIILTTCGGLSYSFTALADEAASDVFVANAERGVVVGRNVLKETECSFRTLKDEWEGRFVGRLNYSFSEPSPINSISPGHFQKEFFQRRLVHKGPGFFERVIGGRETPTRLEIDYDANLQIVEMRDYFNGELTDTCVFD